MYKRNQQGKENPEKSSREQPPEILDYLMRIMSANHSLGKKEVKERKRGIGNVS